MTLKHWLITSALAVATIPAVAELYRWVDSSGTVHYSDTPQKGAEKIVLRPTNVIPGRRAPSESRQPQNEEPNPNLEEAGELQSLMPYISATVISPKTDETLWNIGGKLTVQVSIEPPLQGEHGIVLFYDGRQVNQNPVTTSSITIDNAYRGQHSVRAAIVDEKGKTMFNGDTVSFFIQQSTVN